MSPVPAPAALPPITPGSVLTAWSLQPVALVAVAALAGWYVLRSTGRRWPARRGLAFGVGLALAVWTTSGWPQAYARTVFWVFTTQILTLLLVVPVLLMAGQPLALMRRRPRLGPFGSPLVGPLIVPLACVLLLFGPVPGWAAGTTAVNWVLPVVVVAIGAVVALPLTESDDSRTALAVGLALAIGIVELLIDAIPGIVLRLETHLASTFFDARHAVGWTMPPLADQQRGGAILWAVAEALDLPFLVLVFVRWMRADARDAQAVDAVLDAEQIARGQEDDGAGGRPWWLDDPVLRHRFRE